MFANEERVLQANSENQGFNYNTHEAQAHKDACEMIDNHFPNIVMIGNNQKIVFPFPCNERIVSWECQAYSNDLLNDELFAEGESEDQQYHNILVSILKKFEQKERLVVHSEKLDRQLKWAWLFPDKEKSS